MKDKTALKEDIKKSAIYCLYTYMMIGVGQFTGLVITYLLIDVVIKLINPALVKEAFMITAKEYLVFIGIWIVFFAFYSRRKMDKGIMDVVSTKLHGNNILCFLCGIFIGFTTNFTCAYLAMKNGDFVISYQGFKPLATLFVFLTVMIQSGAEELLCRGLLYKTLERRFGAGLKPILISSLLFAALHLFNSGVTLISLANLVLAGIVPALMMYYFDSMWMCIAEHTAWNFTQNILLGLPNSGIRVPFSIFAISSDTIKSSFFYDTGFGIEGGMMAFVVQAILILAMYLIMKNRRKPGYDVWQGITEEEVEKAEQEKSDADLLKQIKKYTEKDYKKKLKKNPDYTYRQLLDYEIEKEEKARKSQYPTMGIVLALTVILMMFAPESVDIRQKIAVVFGEVIAMVVVIPLSGDLVNRRIGLLKQYLNEKIEETTTIKE